MIADTSRNSTESLEQQIGVLQHHDAITGTENEDVSRDYHRGLTKAVEAAIVKDSEALS